MSHLISIVTPCYNCENTIHRTFSSIVSQSYTNFEWIIVDDGSTDSTLNQLHKIASKDNRIKVIINKGIKGSGGARNFGLKNIQSKIVTFLDADDEWDENFLEEMVPTVQHKPSISFSGFRIKRNNKFYDFIPKKIITSDDLLRGSDISNVTAVYNFGSENEVAEFGNIRARNDLVFMLNALDRIGYATPVPKVLATYYVSENSISSNKIKLIYWQYSVSRMRGKGILKSFYNVIAWALYGVKKYYFRKERYKI